MRPDEASDSWRSQITVGPVIKWKRVGRRTHSVKVGPKPILRWAAALRCFKRCLNSLLTSNFKKRKINPVLQGKPSLSAPKKPGLTLFPRSRSLLKQTPSQRPIHNFQTKLPEPAQKKRFATCPLFICGATSAIQKILKPNTRSNRSLLERLLALPAPLPTT